MEEFRTIFHDLKETSHNLNNAIKNLLDRGEKLENLALNSHELASYSEEFKKEVIIKTQRIEYTKQKIAIFILVIVLLIILFYIFKKER